MQAKKTKRGYDASRRRASSDERRGRILQTARNLFGHYGYGATLIERIAGEGGGAGPPVPGVVWSQRALLFCVFDPGGGAGGRRALVWVLSPTPAEPPNQLPPLR